MNPVDGSPGTFEGDCTICGTRNTVTIQDVYGKPSRGDVCKHFKRTWRVSDDDRIRAEFLPREGAV